MINYSSTLVCVLSPVCYLFIFQVKCQIPCLCILVSSVDVSYLVECSLLNRVLSRFSGQKGLKTHINLLHKLFLHGNIFHNRLDGDIVFFSYPVSNILCVLFNHRFKKFIGIYDMSHLILQNSHTGMHVYRRPPFLRALPLQATPTTSYCP